LIPGYKAIGRKVLAGLTLALYGDELRKPDVTLCTLERDGRKVCHLEPIDSARTLWSKLTDRNQTASDRPPPAHFPFELRVKWPSGSDPTSPELRIHFANEESANHDPLGGLNGCRQCRETDLIFGPTRSDAAIQLIEKVDRISGWQVPVVTATATAPNLEPDPNRGQGTKNQWEGRPYFYRYICPDMRTAQRLFSAVVEGVRPRRIGLLYQDGAWGEGLRDSFQELLAGSRSRADRAPRAPELLAPIPYQSDFHKEVEAAINEGEIDCQTCQVAKGKSAEKSLPAANTPRVKGEKAAKSPPSTDPTPELRLEPAQLDALFRWFRAMDVDAVGIFGSTRNKKAILARLRR
jgi:hypothetical protein